MPLPAIVPFIPAIAQGAIGVGQFLGGLFGAKKARKEYEGAIGAMRPDTGITDYYTKALARYSPDIYKSAYYQNMMNQIGRGLTTGLSASQTRRGGLMALPGLVQGASDQSARAAAQAEQMQSQQLAQLGQAAGLRAQDLRRIEEAKTGLLGQKYAQKAKLMGQGLQNVFGAASTAATQFAGGAGGASGTSGRALGQSYGTPVARTMGRRAPMTPGILPPDQPIPQELLDFRSTYGG